MLSRRQSAASAHSGEMSPVSEASSRRSSDSANSEGSYISLSTILTDYEYLASHPDEGLCKVVEEPQQCEQCERATVSDGLCLDETAAEACSYSTFVTYASTKSSMQVQESCTPEPLHRIEGSGSADDSIPTTPSDFGKLFPSARKLCISHDESVSDGNMNLKINTEVRLTSGIQQLMTLFHLRMYDLETREFSLRRYDRNSGREVCHSVRKYHKPSDGPRPGLQRKIRNAFALLRTKSDTRMSNYTSNSKVGSQDTLDWEEMARPKSAAHDNRAISTSACDSISLEFSNYAHVEVRPQGTKMHARYDLEYWGMHYNWKRMMLKDGEDTQICYHLTRSGDHEVLAKILPEPISPDELRREERKGAWITPHAMWISDEGLLRRADVCDVLVATGLMALVDDNIRRHALREQSKSGRTSPLLGRRSGLRMFQRASDTNSTGTVCGAQSGSNSPHVRIAGATA